MNKLETVRQKGAHTISQPAETHALASGTTTARGRWKSPPVLKKCVEGVHRPDRRLCDVSLVQKALVVVLAAPNRVLTRTSQARHPRRHAPLEVRDLRIDDFQHPGVCSSRLAMFLVLNLYCHLRICTLQ